MKIWIIRPGKPTDEREVSIGGRPSIENIRTIVEPWLDGGRMERVAVLHDGRKTDMFVDEIGQSKRLPINPEATKIYHAASLARDPDADSSTWAVIYGPAILFEYPVWF